MEDKEKFEKIESRVLGNKTIRIRRRPPRRFLEDVATKTPLIPLLLALIALWILSSWGMYLAEHNSNEQISSYTDALWWSFAAMQTQGAPGPITTAGMTIGAFWSILSTVAFFGVIIGTLYSYYMLPRRRPSRELIGAIQYNLEELEHLSIDELEALKETIARLVDAQIGRLKEKS